MSYDLSKCFKDTHPPFTVAPQLATFQLAPRLLAALQHQQHQQRRQSDDTKDGGGGEAGEGNGQHLKQQPLSLFARRTRLFQNNTDNPYWFVGQRERTNRYFEALPAVVVSEKGEFSVALGTRTVLFSCLFSQLSRLLLE
jgi:hypothetical protein